MELIVFGMGLFFIGGVAALVYIDYKNSLNLEQNNDYDRVNPNLDELVNKLEVYSNIDYGKNAYPLSNAEARLVLKIIKEKK
jgi:hypothetical protein